jgi:hypothetical protein
MSDLLRAELCKLRFTRSLLAVPLAGVVIAAIGSVVMITAEKSAVADALSAHGPLRFGPSNFGLLALLLAVRLFGDEVHHNTLGSTFIGTPRRDRVAAAKAILAVSAAVVLTAAVAAIVVPVPAIGASVRSLPMVMDYGAVLTLLVRTTGAMALFALLGLAVAVAVRNRTVAVVGVLLWIAMAEDVIGGALHVHDQLPSAAFRGMVAGGADPALPGTTASFVTLAAITLGAWVLATVALRRDV